MIQQVKEIAKGTGKLAAFARGVRILGSTTYSYPLRRTGSSTNSEFSPDWQIAHWDTGSPCVVLEVAHSPPLEEVCRNVQVVVGFDLGYGPRASHRATMSVWRVHGDEVARTIGAVAETDQEPFRDD